MTPRRPPTLAEANAKLAAAQAGMVAALSAAADRRDAAAQELKDATEALHALALESHAGGLPTKDILAGARMKESWFHQIKKRAQQS